MRPYVSVQVGLAIGLSGLLACGGEVRLPGDAARPTAVPSAQVPFLRPCDAAAADTVYAAQLLAVDARVPGRLLHVQNNRGLFVSDDRGQSWASLTPAGACHAAVDAILPSLALPDLLCLQAHSDAAPYYMQIFCRGPSGGLRRLEVPAGFEDFAGAFVTDPAHPRRVYAAVWGFGCPPGSGEPMGSPCEALAWSPDGGDLWLLAPTQRAMHLQLAMSREASPVLYVAHSARGPRFTALQVCDPSLRCRPLLRAGDPCTFRQLTRIAVNPFYGPELLLEWGDDGTWLTRDAGRTCQRVQDSLDFLDPPIFIDAAGGGALVRTGWDLDGRLLLRSGDGGQSWTPGGRLPAESGDLVADRGALYLSSPAGLFVSRDRADSWEPVALPELTSPP